MAKKESEDFTKWFTNAFGVTPDRATEISPKYRILEFQGHFYPQELKRRETAYQAYFAYDYFYDGDTIIRFNNMNDAKGFIRVAYKGEVIHSFDPETE